MRKSLHEDENLEFLDDSAGLSPLNHDALRNAWKQLHLCRFEGLVHSRSMRERGQCLLALIAIYKAFPMGECFSVEWESERLVWKALEVALQKEPPFLESAAGILTDRSVDRAVRIRAVLTLQFMTFVINGPKATRSRNGTRISCTSWIEAFRVMAYRASWLLELVERELLLSNDPQQKLKEFPLSLCEIAFGKHLWDRLDARLHDDIQWPPPPFPPEGWPPPSPWKTSS